MPIFFVVMGMHTDVSALAEPRTILLTVALTTAAVVGKLACAIGAARGVDGLTVALGMVPRGEVTLIFATLGASLGVLDGATHAALVATVLATTLLAPPALRWSLSRVAADGS